MLHLDADEIAPPEFTKARSALEPTDGMNAYQVLSKMMLLGRWIRHAGICPAYQFRLGHRDRLCFIQVGHGPRECLLPERVEHFNIPYLRYLFSLGLFGWLSKHVRWAWYESARIIDIRRGTEQGSFSTDPISRRCRGPSRAIERLAISRWSFPKMLGVSGLMTCGRN